MHKKRLLSLVFTLLIATFLMGSAPANGPAEKPPDPPLHFNAVIVNNETGESFELPVVLRSVKALGQDRFEAQYSVKIPEEILESRLYTYWPGYDPTYSAEIRIWVKYYTNYFGGYPYIKVYHYDGQWIRLDSSVSCTKMVVLAKVYGELLSTGRLVGDQTSYTRINPVNGAKYRTMHMYSGEWVQINDGYYQAGSTTITLKRGTSTWTGSVSVWNPGWPF